MTAQHIHTHSCSLTRSGLEDGQPAAHGSASCSAAGRVISLLCAAAAAAALLACYYTLGADGGQAQGWRVVRRYDLPGINFSDSASSYSCPCSRSLLDYRGFVVPVLDVNASSGAAALCDDLCALDVGNQTNPLYPQWMFCRCMAALVACMPACMCLYASR